jgi:hypothetical protein
LVVCGVFVNSAPIEDDLTSRLLQESMTEQQEAKGRYGGYGNPFHKQRYYGKREIDDLILPENMTKQEAKGGYGFPFHKQRLYGKREADDLLPPENMFKLDESGYSYGGHFIGKREVNENLITENVNKPEESGYGYGGRKQRERYFGKREDNENLIPEHVKKQEAKGAFPFHKKRLVGKREVDDLLLPEDMNIPEEFDYDYSEQKYGHYLGKREVNNQLNLAKRLGLGGT